MLPRKGLRKITVNGLTYGWKASGNGTRISVYIEQLNEDGQLLTAQFDTHYKEFVKHDKRGNVKKWSFYQKLVITPGIVKQVIEIGLKNGWNSNQKGGTLNLGFIDKLVKLDLKKAVKVSPSLLASGYFDLYPWSAITVKCIELLQLEFNIDKTVENLIRIEDRVEDYNLRTVEDGIIIKLVDILLSRKEHPEAVLIPHEESGRFRNFDCLMEALNDDFKIGWYAHGEWTVWHLPKLGFGLFIQYEASPTYFWTDKELLNTSIEDQIDRYSF